MTNEQPGPPDEHPAAEGTDKPQVDGPTVMGPTVGHLTGPTPGDPTTDDPTVAGPVPPADPTIAGAWSAWPPSQHPGTTPPPADEPTVTDTRSSAPNVAPPPDEPTVADTGGPNTPNPTEETIRADNPTAAAVDDETIRVNRPTTTPPDDETILADRPTTTPVAKETIRVDNPTATLLDDETIRVNRPTTTPADDQTILADRPTTTPIDEETVRVDGPTAAVVDGPTMALPSEDVTTTGPTIGGWPFDEPEPPPPTDLIWRADPPPSPRDQREPGRSPGYYIGLGAAVVLVVGLVALAAVVSVIKPTSTVAGSPQATQGIPEITTTTPNQPPATTTAAPPEGPLTEVAKHPLSTWQGRMADVTCELPRFDLPDDRQAAFYTAAKVCADNAWKGTLQETKLEGDVKVVTVTSTVQTSSCGEVTPTSPATQCDGTVYMTPAHLRDTEQNGRYPGRYLGVFLREYARALQFTTGLAEVAGNVTTGSAEDLDKRLGQQATCLAGVVSGAMSGRGAIDGNITGEISARLSTVDAPADAKAWLDKGFQARQPSACNTWTS